MGRPPPSHPVLEANGFRFVPRVNTTSDVKTPLYESSCGARWRIVFSVPSQSRDLIVGRERSMKVADKGIVRIVVLPPAIRPPAQERGVRRVLQLLSESPLNKRAAIVATGLKLREVVNEGHPARDDISFWLRG